MEHIVFNQIRYYIKTSKEKLKNIYDNGHVHADVAFLTFTYKYALLFPAFHQYIVIKSISQLLRKKTFLIYTFFSDIPVIAASNLLSNIFRISLLFVASNLSSNISVFCIRRINNIDEDVDAVNKSYLQHTWPRFFIFPGMARVREEPV